MIEVVPETGSTNADLAARAAGGDWPGEGHWLVADRQTAGRGRQGRAWLGGQGNFMGSTFVAARSGDPPLHTLALVAGLAVHAAAVQHLQPPLRPFLKWPNDLMLDDAKLAGILLERASEGVVVGVGANLSVAPPVEGRATAALGQFGPPPERDGFARELSAAFAAELSRWRAGGLGPIIARWLGVAHPLGTRLTIGEPGEPAVAGTFAGLDGQGALILSLADGTRQTIHAGEVRLA